MRTGGDWQRDFDGRRAMMFFGAAVLALGSGLARLFMGGPRIEMYWEFLSVAVLLLTGALSRHAHAGVRSAALAFMALFFLVSTPVVVASLESPTVLVVMLALPLALTVLFFERLAVVATISVTAVLVNTVVLLRSGWSTVDTIHGAVSMLALYGAGLFGASELALFRRREREHEESLRKALAAQLQTERLAVLGTLAAGVAHELNNPLAYVTANLKQLEREPPDDAAERAEIWAETRAGLERIAAIVRDLKGISRASPRGVDALELDALLRQTARLTSLRSRGRVKLEVELEQDLPACTADEQRLAQVLLNLAVNACDALEEHARPDPLIRFSAQRAGERVRVVVEDNGPGVDPEVKRRLFTPFFTTKPPGKGTGLGLVLSREYLEAFGGTLRCEDSPLGGARFVVELAVAE
ncbi:MAG: sensor histidine kinase [Myxococcota bacterium]